MPERPGQRKLLVWWSWEEVKLLGSVVFDGFREGFGIWRAFLGLF
jgi:hypothetical protein